MSLSISGLYSVTMYLSCTISQIFNTNNGVHLKYGLGSLILQIYAQSAHH